MSQTSSHATIEFDTGIGEAERPGVGSLVDSLRRSQVEAHVARATAAVPAAPVIPVAAAPAVAMAAAPLFDVYKDRNPSLPSIPFDDVKHLPSCGLPYPTGTRVRYRPYTLGESIYAEESRLDMRGTYDLILKGIDCGPLDPFELTLSDVLYLGLVRKIASLGDTKINVTTTCPFCSGLNKTPIECSALEFDDLNIPQLPIRVPFTFGDHAFKPLTLRRYLDLLDLGKEDSFVALMAAQCMTDLPLSERIAMIEALTDPDDITMLKQVDEMLHHELQPIKVICPQQLEQGEGDEPGLTCGRRYPVALDDVSAAFVLPFSGSKDSPRRQITFG